MNNQETELKLAFDPRTRSAIQAHPIIKQATHYNSPRTLNNTYYDTPELNLQHHKIALRIRQQGDLKLQTVKCDAPSIAGLTQRPEWEYPYCDQFNFDHIDQPDTASILSRYREKLTPLFCTDFFRETRCYNPHSNVTILIMIDSGHIRAAGRTLQISELELELKKGEISDLLNLATRLLQDIALRPANLSKAERGYRLFLNHPAQPVVAKISTHAPTDCPISIFRHLAFDLIQHWQANSDMLAYATESGDMTHYFDIVAEIQSALAHLSQLIQHFTIALPANFVSEWITRLEKTRLSFDCISQDDTLLSNQTANTKQESDTNSIAAAKYNQSSAHGTVLLTFFSALYHLSAVQNET